MCEHGVCGHGNAITSKANLFLACFDRGLCRAVSGDTPNSPLVSLVLFKFLLSSGDWRFFDWQLSQMKEGNWSSGAGCGTPRSLPILPANCCFIPRLLNKETAFLDLIFFLHNLHAFTSAIMKKKKSQEIIEHCYYDVASS